MARKVAARAGTVALDWLCPAFCLLCGAAGAALCVDCRADTRADRWPSCRCCAIPLPPRSGTRRCGRCLRRAPAFDRTLAAAVYEAPFAQLIRGFKYGAMLAYAPLLADLLHERVVSSGEAVSIDVLVPVPLSRERMASRGFNQSIEIGRILAGRIDRPLDTRSVLRIHDTAPQASLPFDTRRRNMRGAFAVIDDRRRDIAGRHVGVIDDVMTTGATLDELARTLTRAGAASVVNVVVARTP